MSRALETWRTLVIYSGLWVDLPGQVCSPCDLPGVAFSIMMQYCEREEYRVDSLYEGLRIGESLTWLNLVGVREEKHS